MADPLLVVILGPTGSGKTALSLALAERTGGEIVNCDSVAMYREFEIGTAKPTLEERRRAPHHLMDFVEPHGFITAGEYVRRAREALREISGRGRLPIVAGGSGLYLRALIEGLFPGPQRSEELRERLRALAARHGSPYLHRILTRLDGATARKVHPNDTPKLVRAIEVCIVSRNTMSDLWQRGRNRLRGFRIERIGLQPSREKLYGLLNQRAKDMFDAGLVEETARLLKQYGETSRPLGSVGYKQAVQYLRGEMTREQALHAAQQAHRNYAKRQLTWFRREPGVQWLSGFGWEREIQERAIEFVEEKRKGQ